MFTHVMVAWDGSKGARRAIDYARALAQRFDSRTLVLAVAGSPADVEHFEQGKDEALAALGEGAAKARFEVIRHGGNPEASVKDAARKAGVDLIIVGRRQLSGSARLLMRSLSSRLLADALCPVLVVHEDD